jgi:hypothetical protein
MSSRTVPDADLARSLIPAWASQLAGGSWGTDRQKTLSGYAQFYSCDKYEARRTGWTGEPATHVVLGDYLPPGYWITDASGQVPLLDRRPTAPYYIAKVVVDRFTSLLFSRGRCPTILVPGDNETADWLTAFAKKTRFWSRMRYARQVGGALGSVAVQITVQNGCPKLVIHDARWCTPVLDPVTGDVLALDKRYQYTKRVTDRETKVVRDEKFWYRRVIDGTSDTVWQDVPVNDPKRQQKHPLDLKSDEFQEPEWSRYPATSVPHGLGFCPVVWIQNTPNDDAVDGQPDCFGAFEMIFCADALRSQLFHAVLANADPTAVVESNRDFDEIKRGSSGAIQVETGGSASLLESNGRAMDIGLQMMAALEDRALTLAQCVLDAEGTKRKEKTAAEVERQFSTMMDKADLYREQYGETGVVTLLEMALKIGRKVKIKLPKRETVLPGGGGIEYGEVTIGKGEEVTLKWPPYFRPSIERTEIATNAALAAKGQLIDTNTAVSFVAEMFGVENVGLLLESLKAEKELAEKNDQIQRELDARNRVQAVPPDQAKPDEADEADEADDAEADEAAEKDE